MDPYWEKIIESEGKNYEIKLFRYSPKCIAMVSSDDFGKKFSTYFKEIGGRFNPKLSVGPGWIFRLDLQEGLTDILRKIYKGEIKPRELEIKTPVFDDSDIDFKIFNTLQDLIQLLPEDTEERVISENQEVKTTVYYNKTDDTVTQGDCIYSFSSSRKSMDIYQLRL